MDPVTTVPSAPVKTVPSDAVNGVPTDPVKTVPCDAVNGVPTEPVATVLVPASVWPGTRVPDVTESTVRVVPVTDPLNWACPAVVEAEVSTVGGTV
jgi:hypothetical protein